MNEYNFDLTFKLGQGERPDNYLDALYETGCDDSTVFTGKLGYLGLNFFRNAKS